MSPGPVSDSYDPEFGTGENRGMVYEAIQSILDEAMLLLGPKLKNIVDVVEGKDGPRKGRALTEKQWRIIRFGLNRAQESI